MVQRDLLELASVFVWIASPDDIEHERQALEVKHDCKLIAFNIEHPTLSGAVCTRVTWERLP